MSPANGAIPSENIDAIKIDRSFVLRMLTARRTLAIAKSILGLGRTLDLKIAAVGVETEAQLDLLDAGQALGRADQNTDHAALRVDLRQGLADNAAVDSHREPVFAQKGRRPDQLFGIAAMQGLG